MARYIVKRFLLMIPTLVGRRRAHLLPDARRAGRRRRAALRGESSFASKQQLDQERARFGLDRPLWRQFVGVDVGAGPLRLRALHVDGRAHRRGDPAPLHALPRAGHPRHHRRRAARHPPGRHRRAQAGHLGGLCRAHLLHRGHRHAVVLARHRADPGAAHHLQVAAADGLHAAVGEPVAEPRPAHLARARRGLSLLRGGDAHDALGDARGPARGLYPHGARQGDGGEARS